MESDALLNPKIREVARSIAASDHPEDRALGLASLYDLTASRLTRFSVSITRQQQDAEDALSAALVKIATRPQLLVGADRPWHYLLRMVRNESLIILRSRSRWSSIGRMAERLVGLQADVVSQQDDSRHIWDAMSNLPGVQREVVVLKIWEQMTFAEIAELLQITPSTAASRYRYALQKLSRVLAAVYDPVDESTAMTSGGGK